MITFEPDGLVAYQLPTCPQDMEFEIDTSVKANMGIAIEAIKHYTSCEGL